MASIERSAYPQFKRNPVVRELIAAYTPTDDELAFMTFAYRAFAREGSIPYRALWRAREAFFGASYATTNRAGLSLPLDLPRNAEGRLPLEARAMQALTHLYVRARRSLPRRAAPTSREAGAHGVRWS